jgi:hypothetical protein
MPSHHFFLSTWLSSCTIIVARFAAMSRAFFLTLADITSHRPEKKRFGGIPGRMRAVHVKTEDSSEVTIERIFAKT